MGHSFDALEADWALEEDEEDILDTVAQVYQDDDEQVEDEDSSDIMKEARKKLQMAAYYEVILKNGVVEDNNTPEARTVNAEGRKWAYGQMAGLLGMEKPEAEKPVVVQSPFTDNEILALKKLAEKLLTMNKEEPPKPVSKLSAAPAEKAKPKKVAAPAPAIPKPKPVAKKAPPVAPTPPKRQAAPPTQPIGKQAAPGGKKKPPRVKRDEDGNVDYDRVPSNLPFKDVDGATYIFRDNPNFDPDKPGSKPRAKMKMTTQAQGGDIKRLPFPSKHEMEAISYSQSERTVNAVIKKGLKGMALNAAEVAGENPYAGIEEE